MSIVEQYRARTMVEAAGLLAVRGYENVRAEKLAKVSRMSLGTFYRHYGSKRGYALAVRDFAEREMCRIARLEFEWMSTRPGAGFREGFLALWWELAGWARHQPAIFCFTFLHWHPEDAPGEERGSRARRLIQQVLEQGEREGVLVPGPVAAKASLVWGTLTDLARVAVRRGELLLQEDVEASAQALWRALARAEDAGPRGNGNPPPGGAEPQPPGEVPAGEGIPQALEPSTVLTADTPLPVGGPTGFPGVLDDAPFPDRGCGTSQLAASGRNPACRWAVPYMPAIAHHLRGRLMEPASHGCTMTPAGVEEAEPPGCGKPLRKVHLPSSCREVRGHPVHSPLLQLRRRHPRGTRRPRKLPPGLE